MELDVTEFRRKRLAAARYAEVDPPLAARLTGALVVSLEDKVQQNNLTTVLGGRDSDALWKRELQMAAAFAGKHYRQIAVDGDFDGTSLPNLLVAQEYFDLAARLSATESGRRHYTDAARRCGEDFEIRFAVLPEADREPSIFIRVAKQLKLAHINAADPLLMSKLDGLSAKQRHDNRLLNCQRVVVAVIASILSGRPLLAPPRRDTTDKSSFGPRLKRVYEWAYGHEGVFEELTIERIADRLRSAGSGSVGIVIVDRGNERGHVTTVANMDGLPLVIDGQIESVNLLRGKDLPFEHDAKYSLLIVKDARRDQLVIDERARASELLRLLDTEEFRTNEYASALEVAGQPCPEAVRKAVVAFSRDRRRSVDVDDPAYMRRQAYLQLVQVIAQSKGDTLEAKADEVAARLRIPLESWGADEVSAATNKSLTTFHASALPPNADVLAIGNAGPFIVSTPDGFLSSEGLGEKSAAVSMGVPETPGRLWIFDISRLDLAQFRTSCARELSRPQTLPPATPAKTDLLR